MKEKYDKWYDKWIGAAIVAIVFGAGWILCGAVMSPRKDNVKTTAIPTETATTPAEAPENPFVKINREIRELMEFNIISIAIDVFPKDKLEGYQIVLMREQQGCGGTFVRLYRKLLDEDMKKAYILIIGRNYTGLFQFLDNGGFERFEFVDSGENGFSSDPTDMLMIRGRESKNEIIINGSEFDAPYLEKLNTAYWNILIKVRQSFLERRLMQDEETPEQKNDRVSIAKNVIDGL